MINILFYQQTIMKIYLLKCPMHMEEDRFHSLIKLIHPEKKERVLRYRKSGDACQVVWADLLIRALLIEKTGLSNTQIVFGKDAFQKPFFQTDPSIHFNISHSGNYILCAMDNEPVGVDIEKIEPIKSGIIKLTFSSHEQEIFKKMTSKEGLSYFFDIWTLKESYLKNIGRGIDYLPNRLSVQFDQSNVYIITSEDFQKGYGRHYNMNMEYKAAVCSLKNQFPSRLIEKNINSVMHAFQ